MAPSLSPGIKIPLLIDAVEVGDTMSIVFQVKIQISTVFICVFGFQQRNNWNEDQTAGLSLKL